VSGPWHVAGEVFAGSGGGAVATGAVRVSVCIFAPFRTGQLAASGRLAKDHSSGIDPLCGCVTFVFCKVPANARYYFEGVTV
jgi:hypothetical protein